MSKQINVPDIGSDEVSVTEVMVKAGDTITVDQSIINVEGDKASMEVPAPEAGVVKEVLVKVGDKVTTGSPMLVLEAAESAPAPVAEAPVQAVAPVATASAVVEVNVPDIGGDEVNVTEIMVKVGDSVEVDQSIINVEGDKASMEVPAPIAGVVKEILINVGDKVTTGKLIMKFETVSAAPAAEEAPAQAAAPVATASAIKEVNVPDIGGDEVNVTEIMVNVGDTVSEEQSLITVEGDKASMEVPAPFAGVVKEILVKSGDKVSTGSLIMKFEVAGAAPAAAPAPAAQAAAPAPAVQPAAQPAQSGNVSGLSQDVVAAAGAYAHATPVIRA
ncbi:putative dihydrolipoamide acetyltransferase [Actinobacillus pleuropneumoniae]|nr:putative dihydrolipoamide acetyltransferase [Actinobacillus pleuropneumoniae]KIE91624.1 putative dihydrolipoamide acetyltransferase [Actinobacillus pleuropneumoniae]KIE97042.1 putative dihydrolipoamide acetyltransferase [Actinobacillus pleuropneumoniae]